jgi:hypothetical protein
MQADSAAQRRRFYRCSTARTVRSGDLMAKHVIYRNGSPTEYFWSDKDGSEETRHNVYKQTNDGVKRMKDVHFDAQNKKVFKE